MGVAAVAPGRRAASRRSGPRAAAARARRRAARGRAARARPPGQHGRCSASCPARPRSSGGNEPSSRSASVSGARRPTRLTRTSSSSRLEAARSIAARPSRVSCSMSMGGLVYRRALGLRRAWSRLRRVVRVGHRGHRLVRRARASRPAVRCSRSASDRAGWRFPRRSPASTSSAWTTRPACWPWRPPRRRRWASAIDLRRADMRDLPDLGTYPLVTVPFRAFLHLSTDGERLAVLRSLRGALAPGRHAGLRRVPPPPSGHRRDPRPVDGARAWHPRARALGRVRPRRSSSPSARTTRRPRCTSGGRRRTTGAGC